MWRRALIAACVTAIVASAGCHDTCFLVVGCRTSPHLAVDGTVLQLGSGLPQQVAITLRAANGLVAESTTTTSDEQGLYHVELPSLADSVVLSLAVRPPGKPGYVLTPLPCNPVDHRGDGCVLPSLITEPRMQGFRFVLRTHPDQGIANSRVSFVRTGGADFWGPLAGQPTATVTDGDGYAELFPDRLFATSLDPVVGDLTVDMPPPIGQVVKHGYAVAATPWFLRDRTVQPVGPSIFYRLRFVDSATNVPLKGVAVRFRRLSGIALEADTGSAVSDARGIAFVIFNPFNFGSITANISITPAGSSITTPISNYTLVASDADSAVDVGRWKVGASGVLYPLPPTP